MPGYMSLKCFQNFYTCNYCLSNSVIAVICRTTLKWLISMFTSCYLHQNTHLELKSGKIEFVLKIAAISNGKVNAPDLSSTIIKR